jgi:hypothetical protein
VTSKDRQAIKDAVKKQLRGMKPAEIRKLAKRTSPAKKRRK